MRTEGIDALSKLKSVETVTYGTTEKQYQVTERTGKTQKRKWGTATGGCIAKKVRTLVKECPTTMDLALAIERLTLEEFPLKSILKMVNMVRFVFYYYMSHLKDNDGYDDTRKRIKAIYDDNKGR